MHPEEAVRRNVSERSIPLHALAAPDHILVAVDSRDAEFLVSYAIAQAKSNNAHVTLLHAIVPMNAMAVEISVDACRRLMRLSEDDARRAYRALINRGQPGQWREWSWFLRDCVPRLPWSSLELSAWLGLQTLKLFRPGKSDPAPATA